MFVSAYMYIPEITIIIVDVLTSELAFQQVLTKAVAT